MADRSAEPWYATAAYLYVLHLDGPALAWEYLRRHPRYRADWQRRLADARREWDSLQGNNALSDLQRREQMNAYVQQHFKPDEHLRVQALLKL